MRDPAERPERELVLDVVADGRPTVVGLEAMGVDPGPVGAVSLDVDEAAVRLPFDDLRLPGDRQTTNRQAVVDDRAGSHLDRERREHAELEPGRSERLEVSCVGEEREHLLDRPRHELDAVECVHPNL